MSDISDCGTSTCLVVVDDVDRSRSWEMRARYEAGGSFLVEVRSYGMWTVPVEGSPAV